jgi:aryl-alcohol dehydrogenase-like predicted oxidoreductase
VPLGAGILTGKITPDTRFDGSTDLLATTPRFTADAMKANMPLIEMILRITRDKKCSPVQLARHGCWTVWG